MNYVLKQDDDDLFGEPAEDHQQYVAEAVTGSVTYGTQREAKRFASALSAYRFANRHPLLREELFKVVRLVPKSPPETEPDCECGHVLDEHDPSCTVDDCRCVHFEAAEKRSKEHV